jgi:hypothetical protein
MGQGDRPREPGRPSLPPECDLTLEKASMTFSRPFRALLKLSGLWAIPWMVLGVAIGLIRWFASPELASITTLDGWLVGHALAYGALGWISGLYLGLLFARVERTSRGAVFSPSRVAILSALGGAAPPVLFAALGMLFGAPTVAYLPLLGLGVLTTMTSVALATSTQAAGARAALTEATKAGRLPPP